MLPYEELVDAESPLHQEQLISKKGNIDDNMG